MLLKWVMFKLNGMVYMICLCHGWKFMLLKGFVVKIEALSITDINLLSSFG
jgi:hypothetical protein